MFYQKGPPSRGGVGWVTQGVAHKGVGGPQRGGVWVIWGGVGHEGGRAVMVGWVM